MKFQAAIVSALMATPALAQTFTESLDKIPNGKTFADSIKGDQNAQNALVPAGKNNLTLFLPSNKAMDDYLRTKGRPFKIRRALTQPSIDRSQYMSSNNQAALKELSERPKIMKTQNTDPSTGKPNDIVAQGAGGSAPQRLMARAGNITGSPITVYGGLGVSGQIVEGDYTFDRGVIHLIDVIVEVPQRCSATLDSLLYKNFQAALAKAGMSADIDKSGLTLFAYADDVFTSSISASATTLKEHIVPNLIGYTPTLDVTPTLVTAGNTTLKVSNKGGQYFINDSPIVKSNNICSNGVIHTLGKILGSTGPVTVQSTSDAGHTRINFMSVASAFMIVAWNFLV